MKYVQWGWNHMWAPEKCCLDTSHINLQLALQILGLGPHVGS